MVFWMVLWYWNKEWNRKETLPCHESLVEVFSSGLTPPELVVLP
jgi:hypothetical protein